VVIHEYLDAWWKYDVIDSQKQDPNDIEEWFGLVELRETGGQYYTRTRKAYYAIQGSWSSTPRQEKGGESGFLPYTIIYTFDPMKSLTFFRLLILFSYFFILYQAPTLWEELTTTDFSGGRAYVFSMLRKGIVWAATLNFTYYHIRQGLKELKGLMLLANRSRKFALFWTVTTFLFVLLSTYYAVQRPDFDWEVELVNNLNMQIIFIGLIAMFWVSIHDARLAIGVSRARRDEPLEEESKGGIEEID